jgi:hypothetical protein
MCANIINYFDMKKFKVVFFYKQKNYDKRNMSPLRRPV